jgi:hypothetical protein
MLTSEVINDSNVMELIMADFRFIALVIVEEKYLLQRIE